MSHDLAERIALRISREVYGPYMATLNEERKQRVIDPISKIIRAELAASRDELVEALRLAEWATYDDPDWGTQEFCTVCRAGKKNGHMERCGLESAIKAAEESKA